MTYTPRHLPMLLCALLALAGAFAAPNDAPKAGAATAALPSAVADPAPIPEADPAPAAPSPTTPLHDEVAPDAERTTASTARPDEHTDDTPARSERTASPAHSFTQDLVLQALSLIGVTYRWGGSNPETGLDCSGFIDYVFRQSLNIALPHNALAISRLGEDVERTDLKPGDLVFFNTLGRRFSHVGIYLGDDRFIHSPSSGSKIQIVSLKDDYWARRYTGARRLTRESVSEKQPLLARLVAEEIASEGHHGRGRHGKHAGRHPARHSAHSHARATHGRVSHRHKR